MKESRFLRINSLLHFLNLCLGGVEVERAHKVAHLTCGHLLFAFRLVEQLENFLDLVGGERCGVHFLSLLRTYNL